MDISPQMRCHRSWTGNFRKMLASEPELAEMRTPTLVANRALESTWKTVITGRRVHGVASLSETAMRFRSRSTSSTFTRTTSPTATISLGS